VRVSLGSTPCRCRPEESGKAAALAECGVLDVPVRDPFLVAGADLEGAEMAALLDHERRKGQVVIG
jgi:hypothetical protein